MKNCLWIAALLFCCVGCGDDHVQEMTKQPWIPKQADWPELKALYHGTKPDGSKDDLNLFRAVRFAGSPNANLPVWFNDPLFVEKLKNFESTPIPAEFQTPDREKAKSELIASVKKLQQPLAKSGLKKQDVGAELLKIRKTYEQILFIPGQKVPEGAEAKKYSTIVPPTDSPQAQTAPGK